MKTCFIVITLRAKLRHVIAPVCVFVCLFVGPPYYSQRAVFASHLSAFFMFAIGVPLKWHERICP